MVSGFPSDVLWLTAVYYSYKLALLADSAERSPEAEVKQALELGPTASTDIVIEVKRLKKLLKEDFKKK